MVKIKWCDIDCTQKLCLLFVWKGKRYGKILYSKRHKRIDAINPKTGKKRNEA